jgi:uncharacterized membrane protein (DUF106 family)
MATKPMMASVVISIPRFAVIGHASKNKSYAELGKEDWKLME